MEIMERLEELMRKKLSEAMEVLRMAQNLLEIDLINMRHLVNNMKLDRARIVYREYERLVNDVLLDISNTLNKIREGQNYISVLARSEEADSAPPPE